MKRNQRNTYRDPFELNSTGSTNSIHYTPTSSNHSSNVNILEKTLSINNYYLNVVTVFRTSWKFIQCFTNNFRNVSKTLKSQIIFIYLIVYSKKSQNCRSPFFV